MVATASGDVVAAEDMAAWKQRGHGVYELGDRPSAPLVRFSFFSLFCVCVPVSSLVVLLELEGIERSCPVASGLFLPACLRFAWEVAPPMKIVQKTNPIAPTCHYTR